MTTTGNTFDLAIDGNDFISAATHPGSRVLYEGQAFKVDSVGRVVDASSPLQGCQADTIKNITSTVGGIALT